MKNRIFSFLLALSLALPYSYSLQSAETPAPARRGYPPLSMLAIPETLGKIDTRFKGENSKRWVIHIQDVHAHLGAQENISAIVDQLSSIYGLQTVAVEGAWVSTSLPKSWALPNTRGKQMFARKLLEDAYMTGAVNSALFSPQPIQLVGVEDKDLYEQNRQVYLKHIARHEEIMKDVSDLENKLTLEKAQTFNSDLLSFDVALNDYREGRKAEKFLPSLLQKAQEHQVDFSDLEQVVLFKKILEQETAIDKDKLKSEADRLVKAYKKRRLNFEELLRSGKVPAEELEYYPALRQYMEIMKLQDQLVHNIFFSQIEESIKRVKEKLFTSDEERTLDARFERFVIAKRMILFRATPSDFQAYQEQKGGIDSEIAEAGFSEDLKLGEEFYTLAKKRDEIFFQKIMSDPKLSGNIAVVAGGFHTEGLTEQFQKAGVSYVIVTPDLGDAAPDEKIYYERLGLNVATQTLEPVNRGLANFDESFAGAQALSEARDLNGAEAKFLDLMNKDAGSSSADAGNSAKGITLAGFRELGPEGQKNKIREWIENLKQPEASIVVAFKTSTFQNFLAVEKSKQMTLGLLEILKQNRLNTIAAYQDGEDYPEDLIGGRVMRKPYEAGADLPALLKKQFPSAYNKAKGINQIALISSEDGADLYLLPEDPVSLLLARIAVEQNIPKNELPGFVKEFGELIYQVLLEEKLLKTAA